MNMNGWKVQTMYIICIICCMQLDVTCDLSYAIKPKILKALMFVKAYQAIKPNLLGYIGSHKFCMKSNFHNFVQKLHELHVMINMNDIVHIEYLKYSNQ